MSKIFRKLLLLLVFLLSAPSNIFAMTSNSPLGVDPYPLYSTLDPQEFMARKEREWLKGLSDSDEKDTQRFRFAISPYVQFADRGRDANNNQEYLGDINGRWNMIALLFGKTPTDQTLAPTLQIAKDNMFGFNIQEVTDPGLYVDPEKQFGFFAVPLVYRKYGARFEFDLRFFKDFGVCIQTGYACISQRQQDLCKTFDICAGVSCNSDPCTRAIGTENITKSGKEIEEITKAESTCGSCSHTGYTLPVNLTLCSTKDQLPETATIPSGQNVTQITRAQTNYYLMNQLYTIASEMGLSLADYECTSIEDTRFNLYWRHPIEVNAERQDWSHFLFVPFAEICYAIGCGKIKDPCMMFSVPFGNNGHDAFGGKLGFLLDFSETLEIGVDAGATHFFDKSFSNYRLPTSIYQTGIFPFATSVKVCPGINCFGTFKLAAYHFLGNLSTYWQYAIVAHKNDKICLCNQDSAFLPGVLERRSNWTSQLLNVAFNYDISPNVGLGVLCQAPLWQKRAYASTTIMIGLNASF